MEPGKNSLETPSTQASNGLVFGIVLGSDVQADTKDFKSFGNSTAQATGKPFGTSVGRTSYFFGQISAIGEIKIPCGTTVSFRHASGEDTIVASGVTTSIHTKQQCITAMKEYENKSFEELRMEDYSDNRRSKQRVFGTLTGKTRGTTVSFHPPSGKDTMMKSGVTTSIHTKHQCITAMKKYEDKSLDELRVEDYSENRKSKHTGFCTSNGQNSGLLFATSTARASCLLGQAFVTNATGFSRIPIRNTASFNPPYGEDTMMKSGVATPIHTKHQCITAMKEYEDKSLEELRMADYSENRRSKPKVSPVHANGSEIARYISRRNRQYIKAPRK